MASVLAAVAVAVKSISWHLVWEQQFFLSGKFCGIGPRQLFLETEPQDWFSSLFLIDNCAMYIILISASPSQIVSSHLYCSLLLIPESQHFPDSTGTFNTLTLLLFTATFLLTWLSILWSIIIMTPTHIPLTPLPLFPFYHTWGKKTQTCLNSTLHLLCFHVNLFDPFNF